MLLPRVVNPPTRASAEAIIVIVKRIGIPLKISSPTNNIGMVRNITILELMRNISRARNCTVNMTIKNKKVASKIETTSKSPLKTLAESSKMRTITPVRKVNRSFLRSPFCHLPRITIHACATIPKAKAIEKRYSMLIIILSHHLLS